MAGARRRAGVQPQGTGQDVHVRRRLRRDRRHADHVRRDGEYTHSALWYLFTSRS